MMSFRKETVWARNDGMKIAMANARMARANCEGFIEENVTAEKMRGKCDFFGNELTADFADSADRKVGLKLSPVKLW